MKVETIVNAMMRVNNNLILVGPLHKKHLANLRQYAAFRARILRMGNDSEEAYYSGVSAGMDVREETIRQKDARIVELEGHNYALNLYIEETEMNSKKSLVIGREQ